MPASEPVPTGVIVGRVVDGDSGQPIAGAVVRTDASAAGTVNVASADPLAAMSRRREGAITNASGQFVLRGVTAGLQVVAAQAAGYLDGRAGRQQPDGPSRSVRVSDGEHVTDVEIRMWRSAVVTGTVLDDLGEPVPDIDVRVFRRHFVNGEIRLESRSSGHTDDRGVYRAWGLVPGEYLVMVPSSVTNLPVSVVDRYRSAIVAGDSAAVREMEMAAILSGIGPPGRAGMRIGDQQVQGFSQSGLTTLATADDRVMAFRPAYYPSGALPSGATPIRLRSGEERSGVDIRLMLAPTFQVAGQVIGPDGPMANLTLTLSPDVAEADTIGTVLDVAATITAADGSFRLLGVPPGAYRLRGTRVPNPPPTAQVTTVITTGSTGLLSVSGGGAPGPAPTEPTLWGAAAVVVGDRDVSDVRVVLSPGARLSGRAEFQGQAGPPAGEELQRMYVTLRPTFGSTGRAPAPGAFDAQGAFTTGQFVPGRYRLTVPSTATWVPSRITLGGRDVTGTLIDVGTTDLSGLVITYTDTPAALSGNVRLPGASSPEGVTVVVFPVDVAAWIAGGMSDQVQRVTSVGTDGSFTLDRMFPGTYLVAGLPPGEQPDFENPATFTALADAASRVSIPEGGHPTVSVTARSLR